MAKRFAFHAIAKKSQKIKNAGRNIQKYGWEYSRVEFPRWEFSAGNSPGGF